MAKGDKLEKLTGRLADLVEQRDQVQARIVELEQERDGLDVTNAKSAVARLKDIGGELDALRRLLPALTPKIQDLQTQVSQEQSAEDKVAVERLWPTEREQMEQVVKLVGALEAALGDVVETQVQIRRRRGFCMGNLAGLPVVLKGVQQTWRIAGWWHGGGSMRGRAPGG